MGCNSGKVSAPKSASEIARAENTLLGSSSHNEAVKEVAEVPADSACLLKPVFDGVWSNGVIVGDSLTWADGTISSIRVDEVSRVLEVDVNGTLSTGSLCGDGDKIHWSDGDIWDRCEVVAGETPKLSNDLGSFFSRLPTRMEGHLSSGPESIDQVAHISQANTCGELVQSAGARLPSIPEAEKLSPDKTRGQVDAVSKQVEATPKSPPASTESRASSVQLEATPETSPAATSHSEPPSRITGPGSPTSKRMFADSNPACRHPPVQSEPRKEKKMCCC